MTDHSALMWLITDFLTLNRCYVVPLVEGRSKSGRHSHPGVTDLVAIKNGVTLWIEAKISPDTLRTDQRTFRDEVVAHRGFWIEVRDTLDVLIQYIENLRKRGYAV